MNNQVLIILLLCALFISGIIYTIKNNQTKMIIESFEQEEGNFLSNQLTEINNLVNNTIYQTRMPKFATGFWTTDESYMNGNSVMNTMYININSESEQFLTIYGKKYKIDYVGSGVIITETIDGINLLINFISYNDDSNLNQPFNAIDGLPRCVINLQGINEKSFLSYKLLNGKLLSNNQSELKRIIQSKIFDYVQPQLNYDVVTYKKTTASDYRFPPNMITFTSSTIPLKNISPTKIKKIKGPMKNIIMIAYKRYFSCVNKEKINTQLSQRYSLQFISNKGLHNQITIKPIQEELLLNGITNSCNPIGTMLYYFYPESYTESYTLNNQPNITSASDCQKAGGKNYAYCDTSKVHYCCNVCNKSAICSSNSSIKNCACQNLNEINKNKLRLSGGIQNTFSNNINMPDLSNISNNMKINYTYKTIWLTTNSLTEPFTFTIFNKNLTI